MKQHTALTAPNQFAEINGRVLAYRSIGEGLPIVLAVRFRGNMDAWDPAFLDALAAHGFRVITFDPSGLGLSTGERTYDPLSMAKDIPDLLDALDLREAVVGGWSLGGLAAQVAIASYPERFTHGVLIGTNPPGPNVKGAEQLFYDTAGRAENGLEDEIVLFFEPKSQASRQAAVRSAERIAQRREGRSVPVPADWAAKVLGDKPKSPLFPALPVLEALKTTTIPILHLGGDHDIIFPVENWYALNEQLPTVQLLTYPRAGHGPQHEHPEASAQHIAAFVRSTRK
jgi:pimeloyl-ACP methyl ester carboxylesterase